MKEKLTKRVQTLEAEYQKGQERLQALDAEAANVRTALLRISGAIQVLKEELGLDKNEASEVSQNGEVELTKE